MDLEYLQRLEENIARECHPEARDFESLGQGSFIKFLNRHRETAKALGDMILIDGQVAKEKVGTGISMEDVYEFIIQCGLNKPQVSTCYFLIKFEVLHSVSQKCI